MEFSDDRPIYLQIADDIRRAILTGGLKPGTRLMSTTQYATAHRINPATANKAFGVLVGEGIVEKRRGIGMFVTTSAPEELRSRGRAGYLQTTLSPALDEGLALGFAPVEVSNLASDYLLTPSRHQKVAPDTSTGQDEQGKSAMSPAVKRTEEKE